MASCQIIAFIVVLPAFGAMCALFYIGVKVGLKTSM
jgi:hypothetical protein